HQSREVFRQLLNLQLRLNLCLTSEPVNLGEEACRDFELVKVDSPAFGARFNPIELSLSDKLVNGLEGHSLAEKLVRGQRKGDGDHLIHTSVMILKIHTF